jgi:hypothetical protein
MTETFEHPDDHTGDAGHDDPGHVEDQPVAHDDPLHFDDLAVDEPQLPEPEATPESAAGGEVWHSDPQADDELRAWLDAGAPTLDPPPGFEQQLADELASEAERQGQPVDDLVREVLERLRRS